MKSLASLVVLLCCLGAISAAPNKVVCYYGSWAVYRPGDGMFDVENIDTSLCTHLIYTFVGISQDGTVHVLDTWNDVDKGK